MNKVARFMEGFWMAVAIGTGIAALWVIVADGFEAGRQWLWFPGIALAMWFFRRLTRRKLEAMQERQRGGTGTGR